jgi:uncharacterized protein (TIGR03435 family)
MRIVALLTLTSSAILAQATAPQPAFETATVTPNSSGSASSKTDWDNGLVRSTNVSLRRYIASAYDVDDDQISGPDWLGTARFDLVAKAAAPVEDQQIMAMLRTLLAERFQLALHRETREMRGYALIMAQGGSKLRRAAPDGNSRTRSRPGNITGEHTSMAELADAIKRLTGLRVVDMTGLDGVFDFTLVWGPSSSYVAGAQSPNDSASKSDPRNLSPSLSPSLVSALQEQLGLKLEERTLPVEILVIDHIERTPPAASR